MNMKATAKLRLLLAKDEAIIAPCAYDALSACAIECAGFSMMGTTGYGLHGAILGTPDNGELSFKEMLDAVGNITAATQLPVLADAEGGYGGVLNTVRTVRAFERAGAAGLFLEDQRFPPNCPFIKQTEVISVEEMCEKIRAAVNTREDPDFIIVARSDAPFEEAVQRAEEYRKAGADMIKIVPKTKAELEKIPELVNAPLHLGFMSNKEINKGITAYDAAKMGYKIITFPMTSLFAACFAMEQALGELRRTGTDEGMALQMLTFEQYAQLVHGEKYGELERQYLNKCRIAKTFKVE